MNKPYLIMLPGWGMKSFVWNKIKELLSKDFQLIYIEWDNINSLDEFKEKVIKTIERKHLSSFSILGWSLGSLVAQDIAADNLWDIKQLILIGGTSSFVQHKETDYNAGWNKRIVERMKSQLYKKTQETLQNFYESMFSSEEKEHGYNIEFSKLAKENLESISIDSLTLGLNYLIETDLRNKVINIKIPLLLIHGEDDSICPLNSSKYIKNALPNAKIEILKHSGHTPFFTHPEDCYNAVADFISNNSNN